MAEIIHKELSYALRGVLFDVHNQLGPLLPEKFYQEIPIYYRDTFLGNQPVRLISLDGEILLATVAVKEVDDTIKSQMRVRLRQLDKKVGLIANFHGRDLDIVIVRGGCNE